jgi:hypothetical protein
MDRVTPAMWSNFVIQETDSIFTIIWRETAFKAKILAFLETIADESIGSKSPTPYRIGLGLLDTTKKSWTYRRPSRQIHFNGAATGGFGSSKFKAQIHGAIRSVKPGVAKEIGKWQTIAATAIAGFIKIMHSHKTLTKAYAPLKPDTNIIDNISCAIANEILGVYGGFHVDAPPVDYGTPDQMNTFYNAILRWLPLPFATGFQDINPEALLRNDKLVKAWLTLNICLGLSSAICGGRLAKQMIMLKDGQKNIARSAFTLGTAPEFKFAKGVSRPFYPPVQLRGTDENQLFVPMLFGRNIDPVEGKKGARHNYWDAEEFTEVDESPITIDTFITEKETTKERIDYGNVICAREGRIQRRYVYDKSRRRTVNLMELIVLKTHSQYAGTGLGYILSLITAQPNPSKNLIQQPHAAWDALTMDTQTKAILITGGQHATAPFITQPVNQVITDDEGIDLEEEGQATDFGEEDDPEHEGTDSDSTEPEADS